MATTALVATAGVAAADMAVTGSAEMGLADSNDIHRTEPTPENSDQMFGKATNKTGIGFFQDVDVAFTGSGSTDSGLAFGFAVDLDEGSGAATGNDNDDGGVAIFLSSDFGTVTLGQTDGAMDWAMTEAGNIGNPGSINDADTSHSGYNGSYIDGLHDDQILRYDHSIIDIGFAFSIEMDDDTESSGTGTVGNVSASDERPQLGDGKAASPSFALGAKYALDIPGGSLGLGGGFHMGQDAKSAGGSGGSNNTYRDHEYFRGLVEVPAEEYYDLTAFGVSAVYTSSLGFSAGFQFASITIAPGDAPMASGDVTPVTGTSTVGRKETALTHFGIGGGYATGPWSIHGNFGTWSSDEEDSARTNHEVSTSGFGVAAGYSLGGGASVKVGYSTSTPTMKKADGGGDIDPINSLSVGLSMSF